MKSDPESSSTPTHSRPTTSISTDFASNMGSERHAASTSNGHTSLTSPTTNGFTTNGTSPSSLKKSLPISRPMFQSSTLYPDSSISREEFVRVVVQALRDVGYSETAETLETESGFVYQIPEVEEFKAYVLNGEWYQVMEGLESLGVEDTSLLEMAKFLVIQQKYLELLEKKQTGAALQVLRHELAPLTDTDRLQHLSSLMMCSTPQELMDRAQWDGVAGLSRPRLLQDLQTFIPHSTMLPPRRLDTLLHQSLAHQRSSCLYHNSRSRFSLYSDHECSPERFPRVTSHVLAVHLDEVWHVQWSHDGKYLASASKDKTAIIWRIGARSAPMTRECVPEHILREHPSSVGTLAWSTDDSILLTNADSVIKMWNTKTGLCIRELETHTDTVSALVWLPDGSGFVSGSLDKRIIFYNSDGTTLDMWTQSDLRVLDLAISPDGVRLVALGISSSPPPSNAVSTTSVNRVETITMGLGAGSSPRGTGSTSNGAPAPQTAHLTSRMQKQMVIYNLGTRAVENTIMMTGELTSLKISDDSKFALVNQAPDEVHLFDLDTARLVRKFTGQKQGRDVIRSCFGGADGNFIVSGSEDAKVYVWHRDSGALLEVLPGHGWGSVNSVAWNPKDENLFASCSDDNTIRIWDSPSVGSRKAEARANNGSNGSTSNGTSGAWDGNIQSEAID